MLSMLAIDDKGALWCFSLLVDDMKVFHSKKRDTLRKTIYQTTCTLFLPVNKENNKSL